MALARFSTASRSHLLPAGVPEGEGVCTTACDCLSLGSVCLIRYGPALNSMLSRQDAITPGKTRCHTRAQADSEFKFDSAHLPCKPHQMNPSPGTRLMIPHVPSCPPTGLPERRSQAAGRDADKACGFKESRSVHASSHRERDCRDVRLPRKACRSLARASQQTASEAIR